MNTPAIIKEIPKGAPTMVMVNITPSAIKTIPMIAPMIFPVTFKTKPTIPNTNLNGKLIMSTINFISTSYNIISNIHFFGSPCKRSGCPIGTSSIPFSLAPKPSIVL